MVRIIPFLLLPLSIFSQNSSTYLLDLMKHKNITWIAEYYNDFILHPNNDFILHPNTERVVGQNMNKVKTLKYLNEAEHSDEEFYVQELVMEAAKKGLMPIYKDVDCLQKTSFDSVNQRHHDSVESIQMNEPIEYSSIIKCTFGRENKINLNNVPFFRAHQIIFYDSLNAQFGLKTIAIAPVIAIYDNNNKISWHPLFWMKASDLNIKKDLSDKNIIWAGQLRKKLPFKSDNVTTLKQANIEEPRKSFFEAARLKLNIPFYDSYTRIMDKRETVMLPEERKKLFYEEIEDTSQMQTDEKVTKLVYNPSIMDNIKGLDLVQNWYWDDKKKSFEIWHLGTSMLFYQYDDAGNLLGSQPLFYRRTDD
jgi:Gliding motility associated protein GldN